MVALFPMAKVDDGTKSGSWRIAGCVIAPSTRTSLPQRCRPAATRTSQARASPTSASCAASGPIRRSPWRASRYRPTRGRPALLRSPCARGDLRADAMPGSAAIAFASAVAALASNHARADQARHPRRSPLAHRGAQLRARAANRRRALDVPHARRARRLRPDQRARHRVHHGQFQLRRIVAADRHRAHGLPHLERTRFPVVDEARLARPRARDAPASPPGCGAAARARRAAATASRCRRRASPNRRGGRRRRIRADAAAPVPGRPWRASRDRACCPARPRAPPRNGAPAPRCRRGRVARRSSSTAGSLAISMRARNASSRRSTSGCQRDGAGLRRQRCVSGDGACAPRGERRQAKAPRRWQRAESALRSMKSRIASRTGTCAAAPSRPAACA